MSLLLVVLNFSSFIGVSALSGMIVDVDVVRPAPPMFLRGPKWVSLNSAAYISQSNEETSMVNVALTFGKIPGHDAVNCISSWKKSLESRINR